jgi:hypothetical protein
MVTTSAWPVTIDGARIDTLGYNIETLSGRDYLPVQRYTTQVIPGRNGVQVAYEDAFEQGLFVLRGWVIGADADGNVPTTQRQEFEKNMELLFGLLANARGRNVELRQTSAATGGVRRANGILTEAVTPELFSPEAARFVMTFTLPDGVWEDVTTPADFSLVNAVSVGASNVTTLLDGTAPIDDGRFLVTGPVATPRLTDVSSGAWIQLNRTLAAGQNWLFDCNTRVSRFGTGLTLASADSSGTDDWPNTVHSGQFSMFKMHPYLFSGVTRYPRLTLTGTGSTAATAFAVRAKRKYA